MDSEYFLDDVLAGSWGATKSGLNHAKTEAALAGRLEEPDLDVAMSLAELVNDEYEEFGTQGNNVLGDKDIALAQRALTAVLARLGITLALPWRDFTRFKTYWVRNGGYGSWQARREMLGEHFSPVFEALENRLSVGGLGGTAEPISPSAVTGWPRVDMELAALRERFGTASTPQDYRDVGNRCVAVLEALGMVVYDPDKHLRHGEEVPGKEKSKQRLERYVEDSLAGKSNEAVRGIARKVVELSHSVKHQESPTRRDAGIAADSTILLANILRRAEQDF